MKKENILNFSYNQEVREIKTPSRRQHNNSISNFPRINNVDKSNAKINNSKDITQNANHNFSINKIIGNLNHNISMDFGEQNKTSKHAARGNMSTGSAFKRAGVQSFGKTSLNGIL